MGFYEYDRGTARNSGRRQLVRDSRPVLWTDPENWMKRLVALPGPYRYRYVLGDTTELANAQAQPHARRPLERGGRPTPGPVREPFLSTSTLELRVRNYRSEPMPLKTGIVLPEGWKASPDVASLDVPAGRSAGLAAHALDVKAIEANSQQFVPDREQGLGETLS